MSRSTISTFQLFERFPDQEADPNSKPDGPEEIHFYWPGRVGRSTDEAVSGEWRLA